MTERNNLVKIGAEKLKEGYSLNQIEAELYKSKPQKGEVNKALKRIERIQKESQAKAEKEAAIKARDQNAQDAKSKDLKAESVSTAKAGKRSFFWIWFLVLLIIMIVAYLFYTGSISLGNFNLNNFNINFK